MTYRDLRSARALQYERLRSAAKSRTRSLPPKTKNVRVSFRGTGTIALGRPRLAI